MNSVGGLTALTLVVVSAVAGCGGGEPESTKYVQTWGKDIVDTTCDEFVGQLTEHQRFVMSGDMLVRLWRSEDPESPIPSDDVMTAFAAVVASTCEDNDGLEVAESAALVYSRNDWSP